MEPKTMPFRAAVAIFLILMAGLSGLTIFLYDALNLSSQLASALFFGVLGVLAHGWSAYGQGRGWRRLGFALWGLSALGLIGEAINTFSIHPALLFAAVCFLAGGLLIAWQRRRHSTTAPATPSLPAAEWRPLMPGTDVSLKDQASAADREVSVPSKQH